MITFLKPYVNIYPFDKWATLLVEQLVLRNMAVPGMHVKLRDYGSGAERLRMVDSVSGDDFHIEFGRNQRTLPGGRWGDCAAVRRMVFGQTSLEVWHDHSAPRLTMYNGDDWERDRYAFLRYPCDRPRCRLQGATSETMEHFAAHLKAIAARAMAAPPAAQLLDPAIASPVIPVPENIFDGRDILAQVEYGDLCRIDDANAVAVHPADRYAAPPHYRLLALGEGRGVHDLNSLAWDTYVWCYVDGLTGELPLEAERMTSFVASMPDGIVKLKLNRANDVWVIDLEPGDAVRAAVVARSKAAGRACLTSHDVDTFKVCRAQTLVELTEYYGAQRGRQIDMPSIGDLPSPTVVVGEYARPMVLVRRELDLDEVEIVHRAEYRRHG